MNREYKAAIVGVKNLKGKILKETLEKMKLNFRSFRLYEPGIGEYALFDSFRDEAMVVRNPRKGDMEGMDIVFFTVPVEDELFLAPKISVDLSGFRKDLPPVVSGINDEGIESDRIFNPPPGVIALSHLLHPIADIVEYGFSILIEPASEKGEKAMDELFSQAINLLNMEEIPQKELGEVLAFDLLPKGGKRGKGKFTREELEIVEEIKKVTEVNEFYTFILRSGIFHRYSSILFLKLKKNISIKKLEEILSEGKYLMIEEGKLSPSKFKEEEGFYIHLSEIRKGQGGKYWMWTVFDNLKRGAVFNAIEAGMKLLRRKYEVIN